METVKEEKDVMENVKEEKEAFKEEEVDQNQKKRNKSANNELTEFINKSKSIKTKKFIDSGLSS